MPTNHAERREQPDPLRIALSIWSVSILLAVLILSRRIAGAFEVTPSGLLVVLATALLFSAGIVASFLCRSRNTLRTLHPQAPSPPKNASKTEPASIGGEGWGEGARFGARFEQLTTTIRQQIKSSRFLPTILTILPPVVFGFALTSATSAQMSILTLAVATTTFVWHLPPLQPQPAATASDPDADITLEVPAIEAANINSQLTRRVDQAAGCESLEGTAVARFEPGQKFAVVHVAFCPPTFSMPEVECEPLDEADVRWKLSVVQPYGIRIDVTRRGDLNQEAEVPIAYFATAAAGNSRAA